MAVTILCECDGLPPHEHAIRMVQDSSGCYGGEYTEDIARFSVPWKAVARRALKQQRFWEPDWRVHPGELIEEELAERGMTQTELATLSSYTLKHINRIVRGHADITAEAAIRLERVLGISAVFWLGMQAAWDLHKAMEVAS